MQCEGLPKGPVQLLWASLLVYIKCIIEQKIHQGEKLKDKGVKSSVDFQLKQSSSEGKAI